MRFDSNPSVALGNSRDGWYGTQAAESERGPSLRQSEGALVLLFDRADAAFLVGMHPPNARVVVRKLES